MNPDPTLDITTEGGEPSGASTTDQSTIDALLANASQAASSGPPASDPAAGGGSESAGAAGEATPMPLGDFGDLQQGSFGDPERNIQLLRDVMMRVKVELGRGKMHLRDVLRLTEGSVIELEKNAGDPLEIFVNDRLVAKGEVLVLNENFCVRLTQIFSAEECTRLKGNA